MISSTPDGELWLTRSDQARSVSAELELSRNILKISNPKNSRDRFGEYTVKTQNGAKGTATDSFFSRPRPRTIIPEKGSNAAGARMRAAWHAKVTAARADSLAVTVAGWRDSAGDLYSVHTIIPVNAPEMQVAGDWQITETGFKLSASEGETTELTLRRPDAFTPEPGRGGCMKRALEKLSRNIKMTVARGIVRAIEDSGELQKLQVSILADETADDVERLQNYGFASHPLPDSTAALVFIGGLSRPGNGDCR